MTLEDNDNQPNLHTSTYDTYKQGRTHTHTHTHTHTYIRPDVPLKLPTASGINLCGLVVRVLGCRSGGLGSIPGTSRKKVVGLERGPLSLVTTTEELLDRKVAVPV
jgi:hypothetical protein